MYQVLREVFTLLPPLFLTTGIIITLPQSWGWRFRKWSVISLGGRNALPAPLSPLPIRFLLTPQSLTQKSPTPGSPSGLRKNPFLPSSLWAVLLPLVPILPLGLSCLYPRCELPIGKESDLFV